MRIADVPEPGAYRSRRPFISGRSDEELHVIRLHFAGSQALIKRPSFPKFDSEHILSYKSKNENVAVRLCLGYVY